MLAQDPQTRKGIPEAEMRLRWPKTYAYLKQFEGDPEEPEHGTLRGRATKAVRDPIERGAPFYSMFGVGPYSLASFRVVWGGQVAPALNVSVCGLDEGERSILNDQTAYLIPFDNEAEAHYLAALLNSSPVRLFYSCLAYKHTSVNFIQGLAIENYQPQRNNKHEMLSSLSQQCHTAKQKNRQGEVATLEAEINAIAARMWKITDTELKAIQKALSDL